MKNNKKDFTTIMTNILLTLAVGCILTLLVYNVLFRKEDTKPQANYTFKEYYYQADIMPFELDSVLSMYEQDTLNIVIQYTYNDTIYDLYTSLIEADYLRTYIDQLYYYEDLLNVQQPELVREVEDSIDELKSNILCNSHIEYIDNEFFNGYIWIYDGCPIYRLNHE